MNTLNFTELDENEIVDSSISLGAFSSNETVNSSIHYDFFIDLIKIDEIINKLRTLSLNIDNLLNNIPENAIKDCWKTSEADIFINEIEKCNKDKKIICYKLDRLSEILSSFKNSVLDYEDKIKKDIDNSL